MVASVKDRVYIPPQEDFLSELREDLPKISSTHDISS